LLRFATEISKLKWPIFDKKRNFCDFQSFLAFFAYFQALISWENINQNTTCYSVLETVEYQQQYSDQFVVIYSTCQKLFAKNKTDGQGIKIGRFRSTISTS
jgi:hypothetical protein